MVAQVDALKQDPKGADFEGVLDLNAAATQAGGHGAPQEVVAADVVDQDAAYDSALARAQQGVRHAIRLSAVLPNVEKQVARRARGVDIGAQRCESVRGFREEPQAVARDGRRAAHLQCNSLDRGRHRMRGRPVDRVFLTHALEQLVDRLRQTRRALRATGTQVMFTDQPE